MFLGVDGGGSKTAFALIDNQGKLVAEHLAPSCYYIETGLQATRDILHNGTMQVLANAGANLHDLQFAFFGLPAYGEDSRLLKQLDQIAAHFLPQARYCCDNDMVNGWAAAFGGEDGINLIAGTGSIAYGVRQRQAARCGGWGELFSDEGSAYWIAIQGLSAFSRMSDGRQPKTALYDLFKTHFDIRQDLDMSAVVLNQWQAKRSKIASLARVVYHAAQTDDIVARHIFIRAAQELALLIDSTRQKLAYSPGESVNVSCSGGVFSAREMIMSPLRQALGQYTQHYVVHTPKYSPAIGAAHYARKLAAGKIHATPGTH